MTTRPLIKRIDMALHIQELCAFYNIKVKYQSLHAETPNYFANRQKRLIQIRPTKNTGYYVSTLHEIGHIVGENQSNCPRITQELYAWVWARNNALVWTDTAERIMRQAMDSYGWKDYHKRDWERLVPCERLSPITHEGATT